MVRPASIYLAITAVLLLLVGLFLPAGRGVSVMSFHNGEVVGTTSLSPEEMGCVTYPAINSTSGATDNVTQVYSSRTSQSFYSAQDPTCGKSPFSMLLTGKYLLANLLLLVPLPLAVFAIARIFLQPYAIDHDRRLLIITGAIGVVTLLMWWGLWVKFRVVPGIGFWVMLAGTILLLLAGVISQYVDPFTERHHPHPA